MVILLFHYFFNAVKNVVSELKPILSEKKLLVSVAAGIKLKDLQVCVKKMV